MHYDKETNIITVKQQIDTTTVNKGYIHDSETTEITYVNTTYVNTTYLIIDNNITQKENDIFDILNTEKENQEFNILFKEIQELSPALSISDLINRANEFKHTNKNKAEVYYTIVYNKNINIVSAHAAYLAADMYDSNDSNKQYKWYKKASILGYFYATWKLAKEYMKQKNYNEAIIYYQIASQHVIAINLIWTVLQFYNLSYNNLDDVNVNSCYTAIGEILNINPNIKLDILTPLQYDDCIEYITRGLSTTALISEANILKQTNKIMAEAYYSIAFNKGSSEAAYLAGEMFKLSDRSKTNAWYMNASIKGSFNASYALATKFQNKQAFDRALEYYQIAVSQTDYHNLPSCYNSIGEILKIHPNSKLNVFTIVQFEKCIKYIYKNEVDLNAMCAKYRTAYNVE